MVITVKQNEYVYNFLKQNQSNQYINDAGDISASEIGILEF